MNRLYEAIDSLNELTLSDIDERSLEALKNYKRNGNSINEEDSKLLSNLIKEKGEPIHTTLYRKEWLHQIIGGSPKEFYSDPHSFENLVLDKVITPGGFLSTCTEHSGAFSGMDIIFNEIHSKGLDISEMPLNVEQYDRENEVLFDKGTSYKITKIGYYKCETGEIYDTYEDFMNNYKEDENRFIFKIYATIL